MQRFYFDHNASTPVSPAVVEVLVPALLEVYGNGSSIHHYGQTAKQRLEQARREVAQLLHCDPKEIVFVSGGTESDNLAIQGVVRSSLAGRKHVVTTSIEHPAVLNTCRQLEQEGVDVTFVGVGSDGLVDPSDIRRAMRPETVLVSVMHANNELGSIQPLEEIAAITREAGVPLHSDGVQAAAKIPVDVHALGVDLYSITGHKFYAPKGIGALFVKKGTKLAAMQHGGRHEQGMRPGTENVPGAIALGRAAALALADLPQESRRLTALRDLLESGLLARVPSSGVNAGGALRTPNTTSIYFDGLDGDALVISLDLKGFAVSSGAACSSGAVEPSHVLLAIGLSKERARSTLRFSLGRSTTAEQVHALVDAVAQSVAQLRKLSPTYAGARHE